ncbi:hypothetical protein GCM10009549_43150 [Streptomyces thermoalcalitolerans]|uniref:Uncharacterized protein n=1 Tax=Streptomyces thermoalcalitolerans TaxID=65605 RepID=A0ABP3ZMK3_9ACTN
MRACDLVAVDDHESQQDQEYGDSDHGDQYRAHMCKTPSALPGDGESDRIGNGSGTVRERVVSGWGTDAGKGAAEGGG